MEPLDNVIRVPSGMIKFLSVNPTDKTWTCPVCGPMKPFSLVGGWYARRPCACERLANEKQALQAMKELTAQARVRHTYTWLGQEWSQMDMAERTFATFQRERQPKAFDLAQSFANNPQGVLVLYGDYGVGKTHLLAAVANYLGAFGTPCLFTSMGMFFKAIQGRIQQNQDYLDLLQRAIRTPLLLLDDIDKLKPSEFREEWLYELINGRTNKGSPLAISSNSAPNELEPWIGKAGCSRLMMGLMPVRMIGPDFRMAMGQ